MDDPKSVARVIDLYKQDKGMNKSSEESSYNKAAASSVKARTRSTPEADQSKKYLSESVVYRMPMKEYEKRFVAVAKTSNFDPYMPGATDDETGPAGMCADVTFEND